MLYVYVAENRYPSNRVNDYLIYSKHVTHDCHVLSTRNSKFVSICFKNDST